MSDLNIERFVDSVIDPETGEKVGLQSNLIEVTYAELKALRNAGKLIPGAKYRMTDYLSTFPVSSGYKTAGHRFDLILTATAPNALSEDARACAHKGDKYFMREATDVSLARWKEGITPADIVWSYIVVEGDVYLVSSTGKPKIKNRRVAELSYREHPDSGTVVPAIREDYPENSLWYYYDGTFEFDGVVYDKWAETYGPDQGDTEEGQLSGWYQLTERAVDLPVIDVAATWRIKYCLDNDASRFTLANTDKVICITNVDMGLPDNRLFRWPVKDMVRCGWVRKPWSLTRDTSYAWGTVDEVFADNPRSGLPIFTSYIPEMEDSMSLDVTPEYEQQYGSTVEVEVDTLEEEVGKGVIYYMEDEQHNSAPYDFKNLLFLAVSRGHGESTSGPAIKCPYNAAYEDLLVTGVSTPVVWAFTFCDTRKATGGEINTLVLLDGFFEDLSMAAYKGDTSVSCSNNSILPLQLNGALAVKPIVFASKGTNNPSVTNCNVSVTGCAVISYNQNYLTVKKPDLLLLREQSEDFEVEDSSHIRIIDDTRFITGRIGRNNLDIELNGCHGTIYIDDDNERVTCNEAYAVSIGRGNMDVQIRNSHHIEIGDFNESITMMDRNSVLTQQCKVGSFNGGVNMYGVHDAYVGNRNESIDLTGCYDVTIGNRCHDLDIQTAYFFSIQDGVGNFFIESGSSSNHILFCAYCAPETRMDISFSNVKYCSFKSGQYTYEASYSNKTNEVI